ncbi:hypothetical protein PCANC_26280 [Puccinia coronata f. sp. avenae]|uniref:Uncharacterized protein n=1 Tax=Puccinia coronata f. sp. avenae TaxID=200324 RepID=A0A2N5UGP4_9BASI|nr:hypothetical protein PCANC_26280 [Puccinia coronata f. sp. avenae]
MPTDNIASLHLKPDFCRSIPAQSGQSASSGNLSLSTKSNFATTRLNFIALRPKKQIIQPMSSDYQAKSALALKRPANLEPSARSYLLKSLPPKANPDWLFSKTEKTSELKYPNDT